MLRSSLRVTTAFGLALAATLHQPAQIAAVRESIGAIRSDPTDSQPARGRLASAAPART